MAIYPVILFKILLPKQELDLSFYEERVQNIQQTYTWRTNKNIYKETKKIYMWKANRDEIIKRLRNLLKDMESNYRTVTK